MAKKLGLAFVLSALLISNSYCEAQQQDDQSDSDTAAKWAAVVKAVYDAGREIANIWKQHPSVPTYMVDGKYYWICGLLPNTESRCTNNITRKWNGPPRKFYVYFVNVPDNIRDQMMVELKHDKSLKTDPPRSPHLKNGQSWVTGKGEIWDDYWVVRNNWNPKEILKNYPNAAIVVAEDGIDLKKVDPSTQKQP